MNVTEKFGYFLGGKRDHHDSRDQLLKMPRLSRESVGEVDVFAGRSLPVYDQFNLGSCTANAGALYRRWLAQTFPKYSAPDQDLSRLFLYYMERLLPWNSSVDEDSGASTRDVCIVICKTGVCPESEMPYDVNDFRKAPTEKQLSDAAKFKAGAYHRVSDVDTAISCLVGPSPYPVLLGVSLYREFERIGSDGVMTMPLLGERPIGGHEMVIHGYSSERRAFRVQNSWSPNWGDAGHLWMPEAYLDDQNLSGPDMAIVHLGPPW
jgi:C1A family cysteine protease